MNYIKEVAHTPAYILEKIKKIKHVALDMDGTIYNGETLFPYTTDFLKKLKRLGISYSFLTNNPSKNTSEYLEKLKALEIEATEEDMYTSAQATIDYLKHHHPEWKRLFILGTPSMIEQFEKNGFISTSDSPEDEPDALIVSFDKSLTYSRLCRAAWWAKQNKPYFATNPDWVCPTDQSVVLVDCGAIYTCIEAATGRKPDKVLGKPQPEMLNGILKSKNLRRDQVVMVGDRIYTDMIMAYRAKSLGVLVLSGEATLNDAEKADPKLDLILQNIGELGKLIEYAQKQH
ncbi:MAG TPA: HAD-IIA family hydrolase [Chitinophagaceae bacterium]|nr:HAD-IIA family hydrolase [Chitinophagaceae bacterium]